LAGTACRFEAGLAIIRKNTKRAAAGSPFYAGFFNPFAYF
jgi:hypothetical protein